MGMFDEAKKLAEQAQELGAEHQDQVKQGVDKAEDLIDERTGGKYTSAIDGAGQRAEDFLDGPGQPQADGAQP